MPGFPLVEQGLQEKRPVGPFSTHGSSDVLWQYDHQGSGPIKAQGLWMNLRPSWTKAHVGRSSWTSLGVTLHDTPPFVLSDAMVHDPLTARSLSVYMACYMMLYP